MIDNGGAGEDIGEEGEPSSGGFDMNDPSFQQAMSANVIDRI